MENLDKGRKSNTIRNVLYAWISQIIITVMNMAVRVLFVRILSKEYLGLGGLFSNVISILSLAELGIGSAIIYSLYEPLASKKKKQVCYLMRFYKQVYTFIGIVIAIVGFLLTPFLPYIIKDMPNIGHIHVIYILFVLNSSVSYFFSYKASLISADQKDYILKKVRIVISFFMYLIQSIVLILTQDYILFLLIQIIATILQNIIYSIIADKLYPYIKKYKGEKLNQETLNEIIKNTKALIFHKVGSIVVFSTDNLIISKFTGLANVAIYSNYILIQETLNMILSQLFTSMAASVGNLAALEGKDETYLVFKRVFFLNFWLYSFCSISFLCLAQDFIQLLFGKEYLITPLILFVIVINFYLNGMRKTVMTFRDAYGLFWHNRYMPIVEAIINLILSIVLVNKWGMLGVLIGTTTSTLIMPLWVEPLVLFRFGFQKKLNNYWDLYIRYTILCAFTCALTLSLCELVRYSQFITLLIKSVICMVVPNLLYLLFFRYNVNLKYYINLVRSVKNRHE